MTPGAGDLPDDDCYWHSTAIGPMRVTKHWLGGREVWVLWRLMAGRADSILCGEFPRQDFAERVARILATAPDEAFT